MSIYQESQEAIRQKLIESVSKSKSELAKILTEKKEWNAKHPGDQVDTQRTAEMLYYAAEQLEALERGDTDAAWGWNQKDGGFYMIGIDPGTTMSGLVIVDADDLTVLEAHNEVPNDELLDHLRDLQPPHIHTLAIEMVACYGMPVGKETFRDCPLDWPFRRSLRR